MNGIVAIASFALVILAASADENVEKRSSGLLNWIFPPKSAYKLIRECLRVEIPLPYLACSLYADGPHGCDGFCKMKAAIPDLHDCAFAKAKAINASLTDAEFQGQFDTAIDELFNKNYGCDKIQLPEPSKTILQATQEAYAFCLRRNTPFLGKFFFQFFTLPRLCGKENGADTKTGEWLIRCLRANTLAAINGEGASEQIAEVRTDKSAKIIENACQAFDEFKQMDKQQLKTWFTSKIEKIKHMLKTGKWNVIAGKEVEPTEQQKKKAEEVVETLKSKHSQVDDDDNAFFQIMLNFVATLAVFELLFTAFLIASPAFIAQSVFLPFVLIFASISLINDI